MGLLVNWIHSYLEGGLRTNMRKALDLAADLNPNLSRNPEMNEEEAEEPCCICRFERKHEPVQLLTDASFYHAAFR